MLLIDNEFVHTYLHGLILSLEDNIDQLGILRFLTYSTQGIHVTRSIRILAPTKSLKSGPKYESMSLNER